ncbi:MAG: hypothetical protein AB7S57_10235 [Acetobacteraceae bacterium]
MQQRTDGPAALVTGGVNQVVRARVHWCVGTFSSGSTWLLNALRQVAILVDPTTRIVSPFLGRAEQIPALDDPNLLALLKSHHTDEETAAFLERHSRVIWVTIRDPRDSVASLVTYHRWPFRRALNATARSAGFSAAVMANQDTVALRYEDGFIDHPETLDRFAQRLNATLSADERSAVFSETRRPAIEAFIARLPTLPALNCPEPGHLIDPITHWHSHHANRTGEIGRWRRELTREQAREIEERLADWMDAHGYRRSI